MQFLTKTFMLIVLITAIAMYQPAYAQSKSPTNAPVPINGNVLKKQMRRLWQDHVVWTRNMIFCMVDGLPGESETLDRLMKNQEEIGNAFKPFYGEEAGDKLTALLKTHVSIFAEVVKAQKADNHATLDEATKKWYANADDISEFLNRINVKWALADLITMMNDHLKLTSNEAEQRINKNYGADIVAYDKAHNEIIKMADMLSEGIIKQFPKKLHVANKKSAK